MTDFSCKDKNGDEIKQFIFNNDGVVYGLINYSESGTNYSNVSVPYSGGGGDLVHLSNQCCSGMGFTFDNNTGKCHYQEKSLADSGVKIVFPIENNEGLTIEKFNNERYKLELKFDYLIEYNSDSIFTQFSEKDKTVEELLTNLNLSVLIEKYSDREVIEGEVYEDNRVLQTLMRHPLYGPLNFRQNTGIILSGTKSDLVANKLKSELGNIFSAETLDSNWLHLDVVIEDESIIDEIVNNEVKFSIVIEKNVIDFSLIMDNIVLNKIKETDYVEQMMVDKSPSFNTKKTIDNKKSWVQTDTTRIYDLPLRETNYAVEDERMVINTKEMDLTTSVFSAIEHDVANFLKENQNILRGITGNDSHDGVDVTQLISSSIQEIESIENLLEIFRTELVDVKSRKTISNYPVLALLYDRYVNAEEFGGTSNKYDYTTLDKFVSLLGGYWVDLIEQVVPSTALWGSSNKVGNTLFNTTKFKYNKYNLYFCDKGNDEHLVKESGVEVILTTVGEDDNYYDECSDLYIKGYSNDCTTIGGVVIIGGDNNI